MAPKTLISSIRAERRQVPGSLVFIAVILTVLFERARCRCFFFLFYTEAGAFDLTDKEIVQVCGLMDI